LTNRKRKSKKLNAESLPLHGTDSEVPYDQKNVKIARRKTQDKVNKISSLNSSIGLDKVFYAFAETLPRKNSWGS
jgi:hypothetical protein